MPSRTPLTQDDGEFRSRAEHGMATAEYAVGTVGATMIAMILYSLCKDGFFFDLVTDILDQVNDFLSFPGPIRPWLM